MSNSKQERLETCTRCAFLSAEKHLTPSRFVLNSRGLTRPCFLPLIVHGSESGNVINGCSTADDLLSGN